MSKWIRFEEQKPNPKTKVWHVISIEGGDFLGSISWFGRWRKYVFQPPINTFTYFEQDCLRDIANFIEEQSNLQRKK